MTEVFGLILFMLYHNYIEKARKFVLLSFFLFFLLNKIRIFYFMNFSGVRDSRVVILRGSKLNLSHLLILVKYT